LVIKFGGGVDNKGGRKNILFIQTGKAVTSSFCFQKLQSNPWFPDYSTRETGSKKKYWGLLV
jgi:hypothetical protein